MTSEIRANTLKNRVGLGTVSFTNTGPVISGVTTIASGGKLSIGGVVPTELLHVSDAGNPYILIEDTNADNQVGVKFKTTNYNWIAGLHGGVDTFKISKSTAFGSPPTSDFLSINTVGKVSILNDLDVDGHTNLDNVSIAGVTTTTDNIHIDADNKKLNIGDGLDLQLYHTGSRSEIINNTGDLIIQPGVNSNLFLRSQTGAAHFKGVHAAQVELYWNGNKRLETSSVGVSITKDLDVDGHTNLDNVSVAGVVTATTFVGNFTGTSSGNAVLTGSTNNELVTVTGANAITGESGLTWTGSVFQLTSSGGDQFPFNIRNDFTPNSQRCDYGYFANATSNNALRLGSINSNGGVTIQSTRMNDSAQKHNLLLNPDGGYVWINKATSSDYGRLEVKGPTANDILSTGDIRTKTVATFSGASPGTTAAGKGAGIVIKPITDRGCHYFFGVANSSSNQEAQGTFVIRSGHLLSSTAERLRIASDGKITPTEGVIIPDDKQLSIGNDADLYIKYSAAHGNNFIVSSNGDVEHHMSLSKKIIKGFDNSGTPYVSLYYNNTARITTTADGITFGGEVTFSSGYNVKTFAGAVYLTDGQHADIVAHNSGYAWGFFEFYGISYHGSIGRCRWHGSMSRYGNEDNYPTINNSMGYYQMQRATDGSNANIRYIRLQRTGTYGGVWCNYYVRCYAANSTSNWSASHSSTTQKYSGN